MDDRVSGIVAGVILGTFLEGIVIILLLKIGQVVL